MVTEQKPSTDGTGSSGSTPLPEAQPVKVPRKRSFFGASAFGALAVVMVLIVLAWLKWDEVRNLPGVAWLADGVEALLPLPKCTGKKYCVAIADLVNDTEAAHRRLLMQTLSANGQTQLLMIDRTIAAQGGNVGAGHERARAFLSQSHADAVIWGTAQDSKAQSPVTLHWTVLDKGDELDLPELSPADLGTVLGMQVAVAETRRGHYPAVQLEPYIDRVGSLLQSPKLSAEQKAPLWDALGDALTVYGNQRGDNASVEQAVSAYGAALKEWTEARVPLRWAATQSSLGAALETVGARAADSTQLQEAVAADREALKEVTLERAPLLWGAVQTNLGNALGDLGARETGTTLMEESVAAYREALKGYTRKRTPTGWATVQYDLATTLFDLGTRESGTTHLEQAVTAFRKALTGFTLEHSPRSWAVTQNGLGVALQTLGDRETGTAQLQESVAAFQAALKVNTRAREPLEWASLQNNLGDSLITLGQREPGTAGLEEAVTAFQDALKEFTRERVPLNWASAQSNLGNALYALGYRELTNPAAELGASEPGPQRLQEAVAAYKAALQVRTRDRVPIDWANTESSLGLALTQLGKHDSDPQQLQEAISAFTLALQVRPAQTTESNLKNAQAALVQLRSKAGGKPGSAHRTTAS